MRGHMSHALNALLPLKQTAPGEYVSYRSSHTLLTDTLEYSFRIGRELKGGNEPGLQPYLSAHVREADTLSLYDQLMKLHRENPQEDALSLEAKLNIRTFDVTEKDCRSVRTQFEKLKKLRLSVPKFDMIVLDPLVSEFRIEAGDGEMVLSLTDEKSDLVKWAIETRQEFEACGPRKHRNDTK